MKDGLPKFKDFPEELGGSGEMIEEWEIVREPDPIEKDHHGWV